MKTYWRLLESFEYTKAGDEYYCIDNTPRMYTQATKEDGEWVSLSETCIDKRLSELHCFPFTVRRRFPFTVE